MNNKNKKKDNNNKSKNKNSIGLYESLRDEIKSI